MSMLYGNKKEHKRVYFSLNTLLIHVNEIKIRITSLGIQILLK